MLFKNNTFVIVSHWFTLFTLIHTFVNEAYRQCSVVDQKLLSIFEVDMRPYQRQQYGYRKRTDPVKLRVKLPLVEECLNFIVRIIIHKWLNSFKKNTLIASINRTLSRGILCKCYTIFLLNLIVPVILIF